MDEPLAQQPTTAPAPSPECDAAVAYGIDVSLLERNLQLSVEERLLQLHHMTQLYELLRPRGDQGDAEHA